MKKMIVAAVLMLTVGGWSACASAGDPDILNELDVYLETDKTPTDSSSDIAQQLADHFRADLELRTSYFFDPAIDSLKTYADVDDDRLVGEMRANWSSWTGKDWWSFHAAGWFEAGTRDDACSGVTHLMTDRDNQKRYAELNESFLNLSNGAAEFTIGKKIFNNGISTLYSPANRYTSADLNDPVNPIQTGSWQLACDYSHKDTVYTGALLPFYQEKKIPAPGSRWIVSDIPSGYNFVPGSIEEMLEILYYYMDRLMENDRFADLVDSGKSVAVREELPENDPKDWGWFGRVKKSMGIWDTFVSAYHGPAFYPVIKLEDTKDIATLIKDTPNVYQMAGGFSTTWKNTEFHGEALYSHSIHNYDDSYIDYVGGFCHTSENLASSLGLEKIDILLEYAGEVITAKQNATDYILSSRYTRIGRNDLIANILVTATDDLSLHYLSDFTLSDNAHFQRIGTSLRIMSGLVFTLDFEFFDGPLDTYFGRWRNNDRLVTSIKWSM
ncbi:MAG: hypothetical protein SRB1_02710 [Desulfobacteraceae bacterium Eth-SRB1]|nr:MAG: hypothetical protein SRB1_02710 [Desulfobacteraceae bacterium Eth-SRB1]